MNEQVGSKMRDTLSALMDGEASELELRRVMRGVKDNEALSETWSRYHLAASVMRKELPYDHVDTSAELLASISAALIDEPVPRRTSRWPQSLGRVAIAASVAIVAIFGAQHYQVFDASSSLPLVVQGEAQRQLQEKAGQAESAGPQFQLPSGFDVPQATARTVSAGSYNNDNVYSRSTRVETQARKNQLEMDRQIQAYMQSLISEQERNYQQSNSLFLPAEHRHQQAIEP